MEWILIGILLTTLFLLATSRIREAIRTVAVQGALLSVLPLASGSSSLAFHVLLLSLGAFSIKTLVIPFLLFRSLRETDLEAEPETAKGLTFSVLAGGGMILLAFLTSVPVLPGSFPPLTVHIALATVLIGFLLLVIRKRAVLQVIGFLVLENGIFLFGITLVSEFPFTVEIGVLLDLLVGIFVMGIMMYHINRTFDHIDVTALANLKEGPE